MQVAFTLATKHQTREIFSRMYYSNEEPMNSAITLSSKEIHLANGNGNGNVVNGQAKSHAYGHLSTFNGYAKALLKPALTKRHYSREEIEALANEFADLVPEGKFSPAEVQNFLITRKKDPQRAMDEVEKWRDELLEAKEKNSRLVNLR
jgi:mitochondrial chaperone BCS1